MGTYTITPADFAPLLVPIEVKIFMYKDDSDGTEYIMWNGDNEELGIHSVVNSRILKRSKWWNVRKLKADTLIDLDFMVDSYLVQKNDNVTEDLRAIIGRWKKIADPSKRKDKNHWTTEEPDEETDG